MATTEEIKSLLQQQAEKKINPFMRGLTLLTGGLAGEFTGTNEDIRSRALAKQALMEQNIRSLDEDRAIQRQKMENTLRFKTSAAGEGLGVLPGSTEEEVLANYMEARKRKDIGKEAALMTALGRTPQGMALLTNRQDQAFQSGYGAANLDILGKESEAAVQEKIQRPKIVSQLAGYGINADPNMPTGQLGSILQQAISKSQSLIPLETSGLRAKAQLKTLQGMGFFESPIDVDSMSDPEAIANAEIAGRKQQQVEYFGALERKGKAEEEAVDNFNLLLSDPNRNQDALKKAYLKLPKASRIEEYRIAAGVNRPATAKENESLDKYISAVDRSSKLAKSIGELAGLGEISKVSKSDFNAFTSWIRGLENRFGTEDAKLKSINNVVQEFQTLIAQNRKDFFGASLTDNEFEVAKELFADPKQANFLPRVIELVDSIMSKDEIQRKYERRGIFVDPATKKDVQDARNQWIETKKQYNFGGKQGSSSNKDNRIQQLRGELDALRSALTNAPSATR